MSSIFRSNKTRTANVLNCFKNDRFSKLIGEVIFKKYVVYVEKIEVKVYVNQRKFLSHIKIRHAHTIFFVFSSWIINELLDIIYQTRGNLVIAYLRRREERSVRPYNSGKKRCNLCLQEKSRKRDLMNKRYQVLSSFKCARHAEAIFGGKYSALAKKGQQNHAR
jgi:hypothetical protein